MLTFAVFVFGALVGSFLNVCIHRIPSGESIVVPGLALPALPRSRSGRTTTSRSSAT